MRENEKAMPEEICACYSKQNFYRLREATNKARQSLRESYSLEAEKNFGYAVAEEARFFEGWMHLAQRQMGSGKDARRELIAVCAQEVLEHAYGRGDQALHLEAIGVALDLMHGR